MEWSYGRHANPGGLDQPDATRLDSTRGNNTSGTTSDMCVSGWRSSVQWERLQRLVGGWRVPRRLWLVLSCWWRRRPPGSICPQPRLQAPPSGSVGCWGDLGCSVTCLSLSLSGLVPCETAFTADSYDIRRKNRTEISPNEDCMRNPLPVQVHGNVLIPMHKAPLPDLGICKVCTEAVHSVALGTRTLSHAWARGRTFGAVAHMTPEWHEVWIWLRRLHDERLPCIGRDQHEMMNDPWNEAYQRGSGECTKNESIHRRRKWRHRTRPNKDEKRWAGKHDADQCFKEPLSLRRTHPKPWSSCVLCSAIREVECSLDASASAAKAVHGRLGTQALSGNVLNPLNFGMRCVLPATVQNKK